MPGITVRQDVDDHGRRWDGLTKLPRTYYDDEAFLGEVS